MLKTVPVLTRRLALFCKYKLAAILLNTASHPHFPFSSLLFQVVLSSKAHASFWLKECRSRKGKSFVQQYTQAKWDTACKSRPFGCLKSKFRTKLADTKKWIPKHFALQWMHSSPSLTSPAYFCLVSKTVFPDIKFELHVNVKHKKLSSACMSAGW